MLRSGDVVEIEFGAPEGREAGMRRPAIVVTAQSILDASPSVVQIVPLTRTIRSFSSEVVIEPDAINGLAAVSAAQCPHVRAVSPNRITRVSGNVGATLLAQVRELIGVIFDLP